MSEPSDLALAFKDAFREHPAGIALITAIGPDGPVGLTASSVASVGLDPIALSFSVIASAGSAGSILRADTLVVHLLDAANVPVAREFAYSGGERFSPAQGWQSLPTGEPWLPAAPVALQCRPLQLVPVGPSTLVVAEVLALHEGRRSSPMAYHDRVFRTLGEAI